jgi:uncharacterized protein (TIGR03083 family)
MTDLLPDPLNELRAALAQADAEDPSPSLREGIVHAVFAARPPGRPVDEPARVAGPVVFERAVARLHALLDTMEAQDWGLPVLRDLDVQGLIGHLIGVEDDFQAALGAGAPGGGLGHVAATAASAYAQRGRLPAHTLEDWVRTTSRSVALVAEHPLDAPVSLHQIVLPLDAMLVVRAFELWTHEEDIRRALDAPLRAPDAQSLQRMVDLAVELLPLVLPSTTPGSGARLVLVGAAGGTFDVGRTADAGRPAVRIVADTVEFCRLVANRAEPTSVPLAVTGDAARGSDLLAHVSALALD